jgi:hypothetical protein
MAFHLLPGGQGVTPHVASERSVPPSARRTGSYTKRWTPVAFHLPPSGQGLSSEPPIAGYSSVPPFTRWTGFYHELLRFCLPSGRQELMRRRQPVPPFTRQTWFRWHFLMATVCPAFCPADRVSLRNRRAIFSSQCSAFHPADRVSLLKASCYTTVQIRGSDFRVGTQNEKFCLACWFHLYQVGMELRLVPPSTRRTGSVPSPSRWFHLSPGGQGVRPYDPTVVARWFRLSPGRQGVMPVPSAKSSGDTFHLPPGGQGVRLY